MIIWPTKRIDVSIDCSFSELATLLHDYIETNSEEVAERDSQVISGEVTDDSFRFWRKFSAGFGQPILNGRIIPSDKLSELKLVFRVSFLSKAYFWFAFIFVFSVSAGTLLNSTITAADFLAMFVITLFAIVPYLLIRNGFLYEQRAFQKEFLEFLNARHRAVIK